MNTLKAEKRSMDVKAKKLRREGFVTGNLFGREIEGSIPLKFTKKEIEQNGYYLRNRFEFGPFRADTGKIRIGLNLEKEFSELSHSEQRLKLSEYILFALNHVTDKLKKKKLDYDFDLMLEDFNSILTEWKA